MTVYVDQLESWGWKMRGHVVQSCHLVTDTVDLTELHAMAAAIGMKRAWFQDSRSAPHYDLTASRRAAAVALGAVEVDRHGLVDINRARRAAVAAQRAQPMAYQPTTVTLHDGRQVLSDSEDWLLECEAREWLRRPHHKRPELMTYLEGKRGPVARQALERLMRAVEPSFILDMPNRDVRRAYLAQVERLRGPMVRENIEREIRELWNRRKALAAESVNAA